MLGVNLFGFGVFFVQQIYEELLVPARLYVFSPPSQAGCPRTFVCCDLVDWRRVFILVV